MGFFSADCKGCGHSVRHSGSTNSTSAWMVQAVVLSPNGDRVSGAYNGYGSVGRNEDDEGDGLRGKEVWHQACYQLAGSPKFTKASRSAYDQGHFTGDNYDPTEPKTAEEMASMMLAAERLLAKYRSDMDKMLQSLKEDGAAR